MLPRDPCCGCSCKRVSGWIAADDWTRQGRPQGLDESMSYRPEIQTVRSGQLLSFLHLVAGRSANAGVRLFLLTAHILYQRTEHW